MPVDFLTLTANQWKSLPPERTVFFFSVGPIEDHGVHLPIGLDIEKAFLLSKWMARRLEERIEEEGDAQWKAVLFPVFPFGLESNTTSLSITVRPYVLRDALIDTCRCLMRLGFLHFVCFSGHLGPRQLTAIEEVGKWVRRKGFWGYWKKKIFSKRAPSRASFISASSFGISLSQESASLFWPDPIEHGGKQDTSFALFSQKIAFCNWKLLPEIKPSVSVFRRWYERFFKKRQGYWGDPSQASLEFGKHSFEQYAQEVFSRLCLVWFQKKNPEHLFRSWYSILPLNKSFFKAWILFFGIVLALMGLYWMQSVQYFH